MEVGTSAERGAQHHSEQYLILTTLKLISHFTLPALRIRRAGKVKWLKFQPPIRVSSQGGWRGSRQPGGEESFTPRTVPVLLVRSRVSRLRSCEVVRIMDVWGCSYQGCMGSCEVFRIRDHIPHDTITPLEQGISKPTQHRTLKTSEQAGIAGTALGVTTPEPWKRCQKSIFPQGSSFQRSILLPGALRKRPTPTNSLWWEIQGYLAHKKQPPPRTLQ